jgi:IS4 transposase
MAQDHLGKQLRFRIGVPMVVRQMYQRFSQGSPVGVMVRGALEYALPASLLDDLFVEHADRQYQGDLLFSTIVEMMSLVVCKIRPSLHAAYQERAEEINVSVKSVYNKVNGVETQVSQALVRETAARLSPVIDQMGGGCAGLLPGYAVRILDGNHLAATEHRLKELRQIGGGPLPGQALVVLDPDQLLVADVFPCTDGHAQERSILLELLETVEAGQLWIADRNFCTSVFLWEVAHQQAFYLVRQHAANVAWQSRGERRRVRRSKQAGVIYEQDVWIRDDCGQRMPARRITLVLDQPTRHGEREIHLLTNLPAEVAAGKIAELYRKRWTIETVFGELAAVLNNEIDTLGYPHAALFAFCVGLLAYNVLSVVKAALRSIHGEERVARDVSGFFLADEVRCMWKGMMIALPCSFWTDRFGGLTACAMAREMARLAKQVRLRRFKKHPRGPKKKPPTRSSTKRQPHVATSRIIAKRKVAA